MEGGSFFCMIMHLATYRKGLRSYKINDTVNELSGSKSNWKLEIKGQREDFILQRISINCFLRHIAKEYCIQKVKLILKVLRMSQKFEY